MTFESGSESQIQAVAISGSPSARSKSRRLLEAAVTSLARQGVPASSIDLFELPADALLARTRAAAVDDALAAVSAAQIVIASTPVYRASYSGLLKVFFDQLAPDSLAGTVALPIATGGAPGHQLVIDHALRPLFASLGATVVATGVYGIDAQFASGTPDAVLLDRIERAVAEALALAGTACREAQRSLQAVSIRPSPTASEH
jgi:FMN reductase